MRMAQRVLIVMSLVALVAGSAFPQGGPPQGGAPGGRRGGPGMGGPALTLTSPSFADGTQIPAKYAGQGAVSPALEWTNVPAGTVAFALILHDPDVALKKTTEDVLHWILVNIPATTTKLAEGVAEGATLPDGTMQLKNIMGRNAYLGPGAPAGPYHHYTFELFALDEKVNVPADATRADVLKAIEGHILGKSAYVGLFHR